VIVSHKYRFIFLRTERTGSTDVSRALMPALGPDDVRVGMRLGNGGRVRPGRRSWMQRVAPRLAGAHPHATAAEVRRLVGRDIFDSYTKVAIERNPWDRQVSQYLHRCSETRRIADFDADMTSLSYRLRERCRLDNWSIYAIDGRIAVDRMLGYDTLVEDLGELLDDLGVREAVIPPSLRRTRQGRAHYSSYYGETSRALVARWYRREIAAFGYRFEEDARTGLATPAPRGGNRLNAAG